jgi:hypothetical protein
LKGAAAQESRLPSDNAKEPDVGAEFFLFFKEALRVHQALSPGALGKSFFLFSLSYAHRLDVAFSMWERGCIGSPGLEDFTLFAFFASASRCFPALTLRVEPTLTV